jgi:2-polyprenyl-3-methyl-5-hydroxy-6-metoxy-1,4-benzoquinol methylase
VVSSDAVVPGLDGDALQRRHFGDAFAEADDWFTRAVDRLNARRVRRVLRTHLAPGSRVLEIGPGRGGVLATLAAAGFRVEGLELSEAAARRAAAASGVPVRVGSLREHARGGGVYDAVVARHVVEHLYDPGAGLQAIRALVRVGGVVYLAVPNVGAPQASLPGWTGYQPYHLHYFRPATLVALLARRGFHVVARRTREPFSGWTNAVVNSLRGPASPAAARPRGARMLAYDAARVAIGAATWPLRLAQQWSGHGEELEVLARRRTA